MAFRRAWKTRNIDGLVYGEVPQLDLPVEYDSSRSDDDDDVDDDDTDNDEPQPRPRPRRRNSFPVDPRLDELAAEAIDAALAALPRRPCGAILYVVRPSQRGDEATLHDLRHIVPLNLGRGEPEAGLATYPPPGEDRPERHAQKPTWPMEKALPFDVYSIIMGHLSRDDIENLRSTCKEIEFQVSHTMFESAVVPFNPEIYGMLRGGHDGSANLPRFLKGYSPTLYMGHGLEVFKGFGPYIKKFGMSFEIDEDDLFLVRRKSGIERIKSYWGEYKWPSREYPRFDEASDLENAGDQTSAMQAAFHYLQGVEQLGLSITSGLGWLHGPDRSLYSRVFKRPLEVWGSKHENQDLRSEDQKVLWEELKRACPLAHNLGFLSSLSVRNTSFRMSDDAYKRLVGLQSPDTPAVSVATLRGLFDDRGAGMPEPSTDGEEEPHLAGIITVAPHGVTNVPELLLIPRKLTRAQLEWVVEIEWAQRAFLLSYMVSVADNPSAFRNVHTFNVARMPSHFLEQLERADFWDGMPQLRNVTVLVSTQWRLVTRDRDSQSEERKVLLRRSVVAFENLLMNVLSDRENIKTLNIGWASGGEHAAGIFGRNQHVMPAPVMLESFIASCYSHPQDIVFLPHVEELTLTNCWIIPWVLVRFVLAHALHGVLAGLTLDSVSLTGQYTEPIFREGPLPLAPDMAMPARVAALLEELGPLPPPEAENMVEVPGQTGSSAYDPDDHIIHSFAETIEMYRDSRRWDEDALGPHTVAEDLPPPATDPPEAAAWNDAQPVGSWPWVLDTISPAVPVGGAADQARLHRLAARNMLPDPSSLSRLTLRSCGYAAVVNTSAAHRAPPALDMSGPRPFDNLASALAWHAGAFLGANGWPFGGLAATLAAMAAMLGAVNLNGGAGQQLAMQNGLLLNVFGPPNPPADQNGNANTVQLSGHAAASAATGPAADPDSDSVRTWAQRGIDESRPIARNSRFNPVANNMGGAAPREHEAAGARLCVALSEAPARPTPELVARAATEASGVPLAASEDGLRAAVRMGAGAATALLALPWARAGVEETDYAFHFRERWARRQRRAAAAGPEAEAERLLRGQAKLPGRGLEGESDDDDNDDPETDGDEEYPDVVPRFAMDWYNIGGGAASAVEAAAAPGATAAMWLRDEAPMLRTRDAPGWTADVGQALPRSEAEALVRVWGVRFGWRRDGGGGRRGPARWSDIEVEREAVRHDGFHPGGAGRFSVVLERQGGGAA